MVCIITFHPKGLNNVTKYSKPNTCRLFETIESVAVYKPNPRRSFQTSLGQTLDIILGSKFKLNSSLQNWLIR